MQVVAAAAVSLVSSHPFAYSSMSGGRSQEISIPMSQLAWYRLWVLSRYEGFSSCLIMFKTAVKSNMQLMRVRGDFDL